MFEHHEHVRGGSNCQNSLSSQLQLGGPSRITALCSHTPNAWYPRPQVYFKMMLVINYRPMYIQRPDTRSVLPQAMTLRSGRASSTPPSDSAIEDAVLWQTVFQPLQSEAVPSRRQESGKIFPEGPSAQCWRFLAS